MAVDTGCKSVGPASEPSWVRLAPVIAGFSQLLVSYYECMKSLPGKRQNAISFW
jgi:hypothetical protein